MKGMDTSHYLEVAIESAREAGRIQMDHFGNSGRIEYKGDIDPVTEVDRLCEKTIIARISKAFPDHDFYAEEMSYGSKGSPFRWIIDPIDGTANYLHGFPCFCTSIALEVEGEVRLGVVYSPNMDELFWTTKGGGAWLNGKRISVSRFGEMGRSLLCTGFPYDSHRFPDLYLRFFREFMVRCLTIRRLGSATLDICYLAAGRFDGFWELRLHPWDVAAAHLMVTEAGGTVTDFRGGPYSIYGKEILATNGLLHEPMVGVMKETLGSLRDELLAAGLDPL
jgi:myo-inositol-1(or 4)-monophosphatase